MSCIAAPVLDEEPTTEPTRSEVAEYLHDMVGQLAELAARFRLVASAQALKDALQAVEAEF